MPRRVISQPLIIQLFRAIEPLSMFLPTRKRKPTWTNPLWRPTFLRNALWLDSGQSSLSWNRVQAPGRTIQLWLSAAFLELGQYRLALTPLWPLPECFSRFPFKPPTVVYIFEEHRCSHLFCVLWLTDLKTSFRPGPMLINTSRAQLFKYHWPAAPSSVLETRVLHDYKL